jgi:hypothetical protein
MITNVTIRDTDSDSPGTRLLKLEQRPSLSHTDPRDLAFARHLVREANPELVALHHAGLQEEPPATVDPGLILAADRDRRLAAILAADVVGYSRLVERDEAGTLARLKAHRKEYIEPLIAEHHAASPSSRATVRCASSAASSTRSPARS